MGSPARPTVIAGNWKMHKTIAESVDFIHHLAQAIPHASSKVYLAVPFTALNASAKTAKDTGIKIGAQNMSDHPEGAFTGEISGKMLVEAGAEFVIVGHSERRRLFHETNEIINKKLHKAFEYHLQPILCIGESQEERNADKTQEVLRKQILECLEGVSNAQLQGLILAYEPLWAIGSGQNASPAIAENVHHFCRDVIKEKWGAETAEKLIIQYGGSVNPTNAQSFLKEPAIDGLLVGGASLSVSTFTQIINCNQGPHL